ncbi:MAG TPA: zinc ribbon domain-containing protein [Terriglobales bacterium]|jgi:hypothetical protein|nr:zinc ribbon domain-containing protein [Terriglobales bacterium]
MSRLHDELQVVPNAGKILAGIAYFVVAAAIALINWQKVMDIHSAIPVWAYILLVCLPPLIPAAYMLLLAYVFGDARRRDMNYVAWTFLAFLVPNALGIVIYFLMRAPLGAPCPNCKSKIDSRSAFCPRCGVKIVPAGFPNREREAANIPTSA